jgi:hypothetical protein
LQLPQLLEESHKAMQMMAAAQADIETKRPETLAGMAPWQLAAIVFGSIVLGTMLVQMM